MIRILLIVALLISSDALAKISADEYGYKFCNHHKFTFLFFKVYDSYLCFNDKENLAPGDIYQSDFSLIINYDMNFDKEELSKSSIEEINKHYDVSESEQKKYFKELMGIFPNVKKTDIIEAKYFKLGKVKFYHNKKLSGKIDDEKFSRIFLDIWLHKNNEYHAMTEDLYVKDD